MGFCGLGVSVGCYRNAHRRVLSGCASLRCCALAPKVATLSPAHAPRPAQYYALNKIPDKIIGIVTGISGLPCSPSKPSSKNSTLSNWSDVIGLVPLAN